MKKPRDGLIKSLHYVCLIGVIGMGLMTIVSTGGNGDGDGKKDTATAPEILNAVLYDSNWVTCSSFDIGDQANFGVRAKDPDKDMVNLYINQYYPANATTPYHSNFLALPSTSKIEDVFYNSTALPITGPSGD